MEKNILKGKVILRKIEVTNVPHFFFKSNGVTVPLSRASSMATELAPVILFLRHIVEKRNILFIEEPEAHLHLEAQRKIATAIVMLVNAGIRVVVTTHSDYFLDQIAYHLLLSKLDENNTDDPALSEDHVGVYDFVQEKNGTVVKKLISMQEGRICVLPE